MKNNTFRSCILTPNAVEFERLISAACKGLPYDKGQPIEIQVYHLSQMLGGVTVVRKGEFCRLTDFNSC